MQCCVAAERADLFSYKRGHHALDAPIRAPIVYGEHALRFVDLNTDGVPDLIVESPSPRTSTKMV